MKIKKSIKNSLIVAGLLGFSATSTVAQQATDDLFGSPFDQCFENGYNVDEVTKDEAFKTAECFNELLETNEEVGASMETLLQYSASWYQAAAEKGHEQGMVRLESSHLALSFLEFGQKRKQQKLASERAFDSYDTNNDGVLSVAEAAVSESLKSSFKDTDFDNDGVLSLGEFTVVNGDATAAGN